MDMIKNGILQPNQSLPFVLTTYITKVAQQMLRPGVYPWTHVKLNPAQHDLIHNMNQSICWYCKMRIYLTRAEPSFPLGIIDLFPCFSWCPRGPHVCSAEPVSAVPPESGLQKSPWVLQVVLRLRPRGNASHSWRNVVFVFVPCAWLIVIGQCCPAKNTWLWK